MFVYRTFYERCNVNCFKLSKTAESPHSDGTVRKELRCRLWNLAPHLHMSDLSHFLSYPDKGSIPLAVSIGAPLAIEPGSPINETQDSQMEITFGVLSFSYVGWTDYYISIWKPFSWHAEWYFPSLTDKYNVSGTYYTCNCINEHWREEVWICSI